MSISQTGQGHQPIYSRSSVNLKKASLLLSENTEKILKAAKVKKTHDHQIRATIRLNYSTKIMEAR